MNIKILDSWLREHLDTKANASKIGEILSLKSVSVERLEKVGNDFLYDIEITTNRPDLMSVVGLAREAAVALSTEGIPAKFVEGTLPKIKTSSEKFPVKITNDPKLVSRVMAVSLSVDLGKSPQLIKDRLEATDIRSLNNVVDVTNYIMREIGHPAHVFDLDRLSPEMIIRSAKKGEKIITLDKKEYVLNGYEIVADNGNGEIIDLLGIMGTQNSVVTDNTKNILLFLDNNDLHTIRKTSMSLGIRTEAAVLNEKGIDPEIMKKTLYRGVQLLEQIAGGVVTSEIIDIYPGKKKVNTITVSFEKINQVIGVPVTEKQIVEILTGLDFTVKHGKDAITVTPPSARATDIQIPEDVIEEIARMYGYHKLPSVLPPSFSLEPYNLLQNRFFWENKVKNVLCDWGYSEVYTQSLVSEDMLEIPATEAVILANPLTTDMTYMRTTLTPGLLDAARNNAHVLKNADSIKLFELSNVYHKQKKALPMEVLMLSLVLKKEKASFYTVKGIVTGLFHILGIKQYEFKMLDDGGAGAQISIKSEKIGTIEVIDTTTVTYELNFEILLKHIVTKKTYVPINKFPPAVEDLRIEVQPSIEYEKICDVIKNASKLVVDIQLIDTYEDKKTFRITYQSKEKNLTTADIIDTREKIVTSLKKELNAEMS